MLQGCADLVLKLLAVHGASSAPCPGGIAALDHEVGDDTMEDDIVVVAALREGGEVPTSLQNQVLVERLARNHHECAETQAQLTFGAWSV